MKPLFCSLVVDCKVIMIRTDANIQSFLIVQEKKLFFAFLFIYLFMVFLLLLCVFHCKGQRNNHGKKQENTDYPSHPHGDYLAAVAFYPNTPDG